MNVPFGDDSVERSGHAQISFSFDDGLQRLPRGLDGVLRRQNLALIPFDRFLGEDEVVAGHDTGRRRGRLQFVVGADVGVVLRVC